MRVVLGKVVLGKVVLGKVVLGINANAARLYRQARDAQSSTPSICDVGGASPLVVTQFAMANAASGIFTAN